MKEKKATENDTELGRTPKLEEPPEYKHPIDISAPQTLPAYLTDGLGLDLPPGQAVFPPTYILSR